MRPRCDQQQQFRDEERQIEITQGVIRGRLKADEEDDAREALAVTEEVHFPYGSGMAQRALGHIAHATGDREEASRWLQEAEKTFGALEAPFEVARTQLDLARVAGAGSEPAAKLLGTARRSFSELGLPAYVERTERLAVELAAPSSYAVP